jgi:ribosomal protein S18 acetylase RimI-like enzyme
LNIRHARVDDAPTLAQIHVDAWQVAYRSIVPDSFLQRFTYQKREAAFREALAANLEETYLVEDEANAIGILTIGACRDDDLDVKATGEIWGIYLAPAYWRRGIGTWLVHEAERMLQARGYRDVVLWVLEDNLEARRFYEALGFQVDGAFKMVELGKPLKAIRYTKTMVLAV